jgi:hypothetical protein
MNEKGLHLLEQSSVEPDFMLRIVFAMERQGHDLDLAVSGVRFLPGGIGRRRYDRGTEKRQRKCD